MLVKCLRVVLMNSFIHAMVIPGVLSRKFMIFNKRQNKVVIARSASDVAISCFAMLYVHGKNRDCHVVPSGRDSSQ